jgi:AcrR family transcriptional regulator/DNA-binding MarR family transcriptional regulator
MSATLGAPRVDAALNANQSKADGPVPGRVNEIQRVRMLEAVTEACAEVGVANVTVSSIISRSGVSRRTFYEIFEDRDDCLLAALQDAYEQARRRILEAYRPNDGWADRIRGALVALLVFLEEEPLGGRLLIGETLSIGSAVLARRQEVLAQIASVVDQGRAESRGEVSRLTAESVVGGVLSVIQSRLHAGEDKRLVELTGPLMSVVTLPYLGSAASRRELRRSVPPAGTPREARSRNPLRDTEMRLTYRTVRVLMSIASQPGASNRELGQAAGVSDQGQISKLLTRLAKIGLIENKRGHARGAPNAWSLTARGVEVHRVVQKPVA